ncbi:MAG: hypothetical protein K2G70_04340 [Turicibacter sp.]|nr:hypothetical protein [Turicibacter sp.]
MELNHQFFTTLPSFKIEELLEKYATCEYTYRQLVEYDVLNYSIGVPEHLKIMTNCYGFDFVAYEANKYYDYNLAPLAVTIKSQHLKHTSFQTKTDKLAFLKQMVEEKDSELKTQTIKEVLLDGHPALIIGRKRGMSESQTEALLISNQCLTQISVSLRGNFMNADEITQMILMSFKVNSTPTPQNSSLTMMKNKYKVVELEGEKHLQAPVQYVIFLSHTDLLKKQLRSQARLKQTPKRAIAFLEDLSEHHFVA